MSLFIVRPHPLDDPEEKGNKDHQNLSAKQCLYLMLVDMNKTDDETSASMGVAKDSLRSYKFLIKQKESKK